MELTSEIEVQAQRYLEVVQDGVIKDSAVLALLELWTFQSERRAEYPALPGTATVMAPQAGQVPDWVCRFD